MHLSIQLFLLFQQLLKLFFFFLLQILQKFSLILLIFKFLITISNFLPLPLINKDIIKISKIRQLSNKMRLILPISLSISNSKRIPKNIQNLQILKPSFFLTLPSKISNNLLKRSNKIISNRKDIQFNTILQSINSRYLVII